ncbi:hypothetical protein PpBr36_07319 [Pyricularia pennisetigena]|uniref:hypothetical protein n=1 Tax=Pyricularia pennisetigena TaxID=1578925 RepID=UPI0011521F1D|nr:hypothetical protein PpBr36_07319 [Pyricularia pennisetigena]TLS24992.1 hypothetical protein PpBr36_07319 [Pyricularia pennisetigena]
MAPWISIKWYSVYLTTRGRRSTSTGTFNPSTPLYAALNAEGGLTARVWFDYHINPPAAPEEV